MAKTNHQKEKLLVLLEILRTESDETHPLVVPRLIEKLQARGLPLSARVFTMIWIPCAARATTLCSTGERGIIWESGSSSWQS